MFGGKIKIIYSWDITLRFALKTNSKASPFYSFPPNQSRTIKVRGEKQNLRNWEKYNYKN
jgi:hypothetical protein